MSPLAFGIGKSRGAQFDPAIFDCNYLQFYWWWTDGKDLDIRCEFLKPTQLAGQVVGTDKLPKITNNSGSITYMNWGGDNTTDTEGYEGIYIDVPALQSLAGGLAQNEIELKFWATWYAEVGNDPIIIKGSGYKGGTMTLERDTPNVPGYGFVNTGFAKSYTDYKESDGTIITAAGHDNGNGQEVARATINLSTYQLRFWEP